jgi:hypothetical protein
MLNSQNITIKQLATDNARWQNDSQDFRNAILAAFHGVHFPKPTHPCATLAGQDILGQDF